MYIIIYLLLLLSVIKTAFAGLKLEDLILQTSDMATVAVESEFYLHVTSDKVYELRSNSNRIVEALLIPEDCNITDENIKKYYRNEKNCDNLVQFTISEPGTYTFSSLEDSKFVIIDDKNSLKVEFLSKDTFKRTPDKKDLDIRI